MDADTNTGAKPIELQSDFEKSVTAFEGFLDGPTEDTLPEENEEALQESDEAEELEAVEEDFDDDDEVEEELSGEEDDDDDEEVLDEEPDLELIDVMINGERQQVTLEELQKGYSRQSDYTQKTQSLAEERKAFEEEAQAVRRERENYAVMLGRLEQQLSAGITPEEQAQLDELRQTDPVNYMLAKEELDQRQAKLDAIKQEQTRVQEQQAADNQRLLADHIEQQRDALMRAVPEWNDEGIAKAEQKRIREYAIKMGYSEDELNQLYDSRAVLVFRDAMKASRAETNQPRQKVKKVAKAGTKRVRRSQRKVAMERLQKTGSTQDATAVFENLLSGKG